MKPFATLLCLLALSVLSGALQGQPPHITKVVSCGYTKLWPQDNTPDCKKNLLASCLVNNNTCSHIPANFTFVTISNECSCDLYDNANCSSPNPVSYDGVAVTDAILYGTMRWYKCHRLDAENGGERKMEFGMVSLLISSALVIVLAVL